MRGGRFETRQEADEAGRFLRPRGDELPDDPRGVSSGGSASRRSRASNACHAARASTRSSSSRCWRASASRRRLRIRRHRAEQTVCRPWRGCSRQTGHGEAIRTAPESVRTLLARPRT